MQQLGAGAEKATQFYGQVAADAGTNNFVKEGNKLLYGDPDRIVQQPDGSMAPDKGYLNLPPEQQMAQRASVEQQLEQLRQTHREQLSTPESQLQFDEYSRRWMQLKQSEIGEKYGASQQQWAIKTHGEEGQLALDEVARKADANLDAALAGDSKKDVAFSGSVEDLKTAYVKRAQAAGGSGPAIQVAVNNAVRDAWAQRIDALSINHPIEAQKLAELHKSDLATEYERVAKNTYERAEQAKGDAGGKAMLDKSVNNRPMTYDPVSKQVVFKDTGLPPTDAEAKASISTPAEIAKHGTTREEAEHGPTAAENGARFSGNDLFPAFHGQESGGGKNTTTSVDNAHGDMQIIPDTFNRFALPGEKIDNPEDNKRVGHRILDYYAQKYNGDAARVAVAYFSGEGNVAPAGSPTPWKENRRDGQGTAVSQYVNGILTRLGHPGISGGPHPVSATSYAGQPVATPGFEGSQYNASAEPPAAAPASGVKTPDLPGPPAAIPPPEQLSPEQVKAKLLSEVENSDWSPQAKRAAKERITTELATQEILANNSEKAKRDANEKAYNGFVTELLGGGGRVNPNIIARVANDPNLTAETKEHLYDRIVHQSGSDVESAKMAYGPDYWKTRQDIADGTLRDPDVLRRMAGPGGTITLPGEDNLRKLMEEKTKEMMTPGVFKMRENMLKYVHDMNTFDQTMLYPGVRPLEDIKGRELVEGTIIPLLETSFDNYMKTPHADPAKFWTKKNMDEVTAGLRSKDDMDADKIKAMHDVDVQLGVKSATEKTPLPPPDYNTPEGIQDEHWKAMVSSVPTLVGGARSDPETWVRLLDEFGKVPTEKMADEFDKYQEKLAANGEKTLAITGRQILAGLHGKVAPVQGRPHTETGRYLPHGAGPGEIGLDQMGQTSR